MARIVTVYSRWREPFRPVDMAQIRWLKISEALSRRGHQVDIATREGFLWWTRGTCPIQMSGTLRRVFLPRVRWSDYDVVKTLFHAGFETLEMFRGTGHPFIVSKLGSVVGPEDQDGVHFYGERRARLYAIQERVDRASAYVTVLTEPARALWKACFGARENVLLVPGAADRHVPGPTADPFPRDHAPRCLFAGNVYSRNWQPEANRVLVEKLNGLGMRLSERSIRLYLLGPGDVRRLDRRHVTYLGVAEYERAWNYFHHAHVGIVLAPGRVLHNNESTKIYHYLRVGLPIVSEAGFPNEEVIRAARLGFIVENGRLDLMADRIEEAVYRTWDRAGAIDYVLSNHTWDHRAAVYDGVLPGDGR